MTNVIIKFIQFSYNWREKEILKEIVFINEKKKKYCHTFG